MFRSAMIRYNPTGIVFRSANDKKIQPSFCKQWLSEPESCTAHTHARARVRTEPFCSKDVVPGHPDPADVALRKL